MSPLTEEAVKALELMPVGLADYEKDDAVADPRNIESIKYTTNSLRKLSYAGYYTSGNGGIEEAIPHAIFIEQTVNELDGLGHLEKALAFKKSCAGFALTNANESLTTHRQGLVNTDNNEQNPAAPRSTFHDFVVTYCHRYGHTEDSYNQRKGIMHLQKPLNHSERKERSR
jgi:hypothetical protein